jgi:flagellar hook assembly protein FlgD/outer membrane protein OmpA-like peptidoglycan-associated protein
MRKKLLLTIAIGLSLITPAFAQFDGITPVGANTAQDLYGPFFAGGGGFTTSRGGAMASALNPAAEGVAQRIIFNAGYLALAGLGGESGFSAGSAALGAIFPTKYGVFGGSLWFINSAFGSFPVGSYLQGNFNAAKELYPGMSFGLGLNIGYHFGGGPAITGDLGFRYNMGTMGPFENFTWALTARGLGKSWIPYAFTPAAGVSLDVFRIRGKEGKADPLKMSFTTDFMAPTFQNLAGKIGLSFLIADIINVSGSTQFNIRENLIGNGPSVIPSIGISAILKLKSGGQRIIGGALPSDGELAVDIAAKPLYNGIWAMGGGATWTVGVADKNPPVIIIDYPETVWISPNNDGKADDLEFPISITDERHIMEWVFEISDEYSTPVRVYRNKEIRPETQGVQNFLGRLKSVNTGVEVPQSMRWDGTLDSGGIAPDGRYFFTVTAKDDNGNTSSKGPYEVNVDNTAPDITLNPFTGEMNIFAPGSGGGRNTLTITQTGSREDLWEGGIYNSSGDKVKTFNYIDNEPAPIVWDGTDDSSIIVSDGVYSYRIAATDKAQNSTEASLENIIVNTVRPIVSLAIADAYFSPNGDGVKDTETFSLTIPVRDGIASWELQVKDLSGNVRRSFTGTTTVQDRIEFNGRDNSGRTLGEGQYSASLSVRYRNGYLSTANSPVFYLDVTPPSATIQIEDRDQGPGRPAVFSPIGIKNRLVIIQEGTSEFAWTGEIRRDGDRSGSPVRTFRYTGTPPRRIEWDGINNSGALAPDGLYTYELYSTDLAGNFGRSNTVIFEIDTRDTPVFITTDLRSFSPNGDGIKDTINLIPQIQETSGILTWKIEIFNLGTAGASGGAAGVRSFDGRDQAPSTTAWNGRTNAGTIAPDGSYVARLDLEYRSGNRPTSISMAFNLRTTPPQGDISVPYNVFAPNGNGNRDTLPIRVTTDGNDEWNLVVSSSGNTAVRSWNWTGRAPVVSIIWDGKDEAGNIVDDGTYNITLSSTDDAGNSTRKNINNIVVDARVPKIFLTASAQAISPKPGQAEAVLFSIMATPAEGVTFWKLELRDENNELIKSFPSQSGGTGPLPTTVPWNGANERNAIIEGRITPSLTVNYSKGDIVNVSAPPVMVDITGPILGFHSQPEFFSPDNDGVDDELFIFLSARDFSPIAEWSLDIRETEGTKQLFYRFSGRGSPSERITWDGRSSWGELVQSASDYEFTYSAKDTLGNASTMTGKISTDVLVIRDGDILRILIPSITFRANYADFIGIPKERQDTNTRVLKRIAEILNKFRDYKVIVEGHANPVLKTAKEEEEVLKPLSLARAQFVINHLVSNGGVSRSRLSPIGQGGTRNVANSQDPNNNWKNRRVEFLLIK